MLTGHNPYIVKLFQGLKSYGENTLWWPKNIVTNIVFRKYVTFNFNQANVKKGFHKLYPK